MTLLYPLHQLTLTTLCQLRRNFNHLCRLSHFRLLLHFLLLQQRKRTDLPQLRFIFLLMCLFGSFLRVHKTVYGQMFIDELISLGDDIGGSF